MPKLAISNSKRRHISTLRKVLAQRRLANLKKKQPYLLEALYTANPFLRRDEEKAVQIIEWLGQADPRCVKTNGKKTPYVNQILEWYLAKQINLPEDISVVNEALTEYHRLRFNEGVMTQDVSEFGQVHDLYQAIDQAKAEQNQVAEEQNVEVGEKNPYKLEPEFRSEHFLILRLPDEWTEENHEFMQEVMGGTRWCVATPQGYNSYYQPPYYLVISRQTGSRVALMNPKSFQMKDTSDRPLHDSRVLKELKPFVKALDVPYSGDFGVYFEMSDPHAVKNARVEQIITSLLASEPLAPEIEEVVFQRFKDQTPSRGSYLNFAGALHTYAVENQRAEIEKAVEPIFGDLWNFDELNQVSERKEQMVEMEQGHEMPIDLGQQINLNFDESPEQVIPTDTESVLKQYKKTVDSVARYAAHLPKQYVTEGLDFGARLCDEEPKALSPATKLATTYNVDHSVVKEIIDNTVRRNPATFAYLVRKKRRPVPAIEEQAPANFLELLKKGPPFHSLADAQSGLITYAHNAHRGEFPNWLLQMLVPNAVRASVASFLPVAVNELPGAQRAAQLEELANQVTFNTFLQPTPESQQLVEKIDSIVADHSTAESTRDSYMLRQFVIKALNNPYR